MRSSRPRENSICLDPLHLAPGYRPLKGYRLCLCPPPQAGTQTPEYRERYDCHPSGSGKEAQPDAHWPQGRAASAFRTPLLADRRAPNWTANTLPRSSVGARTWQLGWTQKTSGRRPVMAHECGGGWPERTPQPSSVLAVRVGRLRGLRRSGLSS